MVTTINKFARCKTSSFNIIHNTYLPTSFGPINNKGFVSMAIKLTQHSQHDVT